MSRFRRSGRLGLRARLTLAFGFGGLLLSMLLAALTYGLARDNLLDRREEAALDVAARNATQANRVLTDEATEETTDELLRGFVTIAGSIPILSIDQSWVSSEPNVFSAPGDVNGELIALVSDPENGGPAQMRYSVNDRPFLVIGVPLPDRNAVYVEATPLDDVADTLRSIGLALAGAAAVTTGFGFATGAWASRRVLLPLEEVSDTAEALADGDLSARLEVEDDRDLAALASSFNDMASNLEERIERDAQFASNVSHELRSPLMTITASLEVLGSRRDMLDEPSQTALDLLTSDLERFRQLVEDLLEISRYDVGAQALELDYFGVQEFVQRVSEQVPHAGTEIEIRGPDDLDTIVIEADKRRLARVIVNLLQNASNYGGGATSIEIRLVGDSDIEIAVEDAGPGVPIDERQRIFDRFERGSEGGRRGAGTGTGLGLALVAEHVRLHDGRIRVDDRPDGEAGACFVVELPGVIR